MGRSVLSYLEAVDTRSFVAEKNGDIVGLCSYVIDRDRSRGTVGYNAVAPHQQRQGIGSAMMDFIMDSIRKEGLQYAAVIVADNEEHASARHIYEKHGFCNLIGFHYMVQKLESKDL